MFDKDNKEQIMKMMSAKHKDAYIVPMYIVIQNKSYLLSELNQLESYNTSGMKMGFGAVNNLFDKKSLPNKYVGEFEVSTVFTNFDEDKNTMIRYMVFETGATDNENDVDEIHHQINMYYDQLKDYINQLYSEYRQRLMNDIDV